ncbi:MAG TPA: NnrU family protein [Steroidobacteraceae bacterium]|jgi:uncharacterized membrane protein|nr:NnrU family protein [Steroidobacteraceae bacterium]
MTTLIAGLVLFLGIHSVAIVSPSWRDGMLARLGEGAWKGIYSVISIAGFVLIIWGYGVARQNPVMLYVPPLWTHYVAAVLMLPVFPLLLATYFPGRIKAALKHPMLAAVKLWALAHLVANGTLADVLLFGGFLVWAVADRISVNHRPPRAIRTAPPTAANDVLAVAIGLVLYALFAFWLHAKWIGVQPLPLS